MATNGGRIGCKTIGVSAQTRLTPDLARTLRMADHGVQKSLTRKSCVTHHFAQGGIIYYDSTGLPGKVIERDEKKRIYSRKMVTQLLSDFGQRRQ